MPRYSWKGMDTQGVSRSGMLQASSHADALQKLFEKHIAPLSIREAQPWIFSLRFLMGQRPVQASLIEGFFEHVGTLLGSGIDLVTVLKACRDYFIDSQLKIVIEGIIKGVEGGKKIHEACQPFDDILPAHTSSLLAVAEDTGTLGSMFLHMAAAVQEQAAVRSRVKKALLAPFMTFVFAVIISLSIVIVIVPQLEGIMRQMGGNLPWTTEFLFRVSRFVRSGWGLFCIGIALIFIASGMALCRRSFRLSGIIRRIPFLGSIISMQEVVMLFHNLSLFLNAGAPFTQSLQVLRDQASSVVIKEILQDVINRLMRGEQIHFILKRYPEFFPSSVIALIQVGSSTGMLTDAVIKSKELLSRTLTKRLDLLTSLINPLAVIILGLLIVGVLIAIYVPIFTMATIQR